MNEREWETSDDAPAMLQFTRQEAGERKLRLLACACARYRWEGLVEDEYRRAVEVAERCADGFADLKELRAVGDEIWVIGWGPVRGDADANAAAEASIDDFAGNAARRAVLCVPPVAAALVREVLGNPFSKTVGPGPVVNEGSVVDLARKVYDEHRFAELPRLAEILSGLGCRDLPLLNHLRSTTPHFRGCWALDAILGKGPGKDLVTEAAWQAETRPFHMLVWWRYFRGEPSPRKKRLLACAACRRSWHLFDDAFLRRTIETAEAFADGRATAAELARLRDRAHALGRSRGEVLGRTPRDRAGWAALRDAWRSALAAADVAGPDDSSFGQAMHCVARDGGSGRDTEDAGQAALVREILGNPLRQALVDPAWRTPDVVALARGIYEEQAFDRMPILADVLEDAGCDDPDVLDHCRGEGPHVRGCWVVDRVLGKD